MLRPFLRKAALSLVIGIGLLGFSIPSNFCFSQLLRDGSFEAIGNLTEPGTGWTACSGDPDAQVLDGNGPGIFGINTPPSNGQFYVGLVANDQGLSEELGQTMQLEAGMHYFGGIDLFRSMAHQNWNGSAALEIWGGSNCNDLDELLWSSGTVTNLDEWQHYSITFAPMMNHQWLSVRCQLVTGAGEMTYLCADALRLDNVFFSVDFLGFEAVSGQGQVDLTWETAALQDALSFDIEWSADGDQFSQIGTIAAAEGESAFQFAHASASTGSQFYRIRSVDQGGHENLSEIRQVVVGQSEWSVFPNPSTSHFTVLGATAIDQVSLTDLSGKSLATWSGQKSMHLGLDLPQGLPNGFYILQVHSQGIVSNHSILVGK